VGRPRVQVSEPEPWAVIEEKEDRMDLSRHKAELAMRAHADSAARAASLSKRLAWLLERGLQNSDKRDFRLEVGDRMAELQAELELLFEASDRVETFPSCDYCGEPYDSKMDALACGCPNKTGEGTSLKVHQGG
jgi:hypothetical protein